MYHVEDRPPEIELRIEDVDTEGVFTDSLLALGDVFSEAAAASGRPVTHEVQLSAGEWPALLAEWVRTLVALAEEEGFVPERVEKLRLAGTSLSARVAGERSIPQSLIKSVSSHRVEMRPLEDGTWSALVVLDVAR